MSDDMRDMYESLARSIAAQVEAMVNAVHYAVGANDPSEVARAVERGKELALPEDAGLKARAVNIIALHSALMRETNTLLQVADARSVVFAVMLFAFVGAEDPSGSGRLALVGDKLLTAGPTEVRRVAAELLLEAAARTQPCQPQA